jgi:hypothetical protein
MDKALARLRMLLGPIARLKRELIIRVVAITVESSILR